MTNILITAAVPSDLMACTRMLPCVTSADSAFVVARNESGTLLGAAGVAWQSWGNPPGFPMWVHVLPDQRRRGVGRQLAIAARDLTVCETPALRSALPLAAAGEGAAFAVRVGFTCVQKQLYFRADGRRFLTAAETVVARLRKHGRIPSAVTVALLDEVNGDAVATLIEREVRDRPRDIRSMIKVSLGHLSSSTPIDVKRSGVLILDHQVVGALLTTRAADGINSRILVNTVQPELRRGWANALLLETTTRLGVEDGGVWFDFDCADDVRDTIGLARRARAEILRIDELYYQAMATPTA